MLSRIRTDEVRAEMIKVEAELGESHSALDHERGRTAQDRWTDLLGNAALAPDDALLERAEPALDWVRRVDREVTEENEYRYAVEDLERQIDDGAPVDESWGELTRRLCGSNVGYPRRARPATKAGSSRSRPRYPTADAWS